jgi:hypothetical protein
LGTIDEEALGTKSPKKGQNDVVVLVEDMPEWKYGNEGKRKQEISEFKSRNGGQKENYCTSLLHLKERIQDSS